MIRPRHPATALLALVLVGAPASAQKPARASKSTGADAIRIPFEHYTLPNGLQVVLAESHATPTVAVDVWYHVGSKNELPGHTGFAHLFEHVMFTGSGNVPYGVHDKYTEGVGGSNNGSTHNDHTNYFETIPSNYLESALWLESDRMGYLLDALDTAKLNAQRDIVKNERRQGVDNRPYGRADEILEAAIYPATHPYSWPVIGSMADLSAASEKDVKDFFRTWYAPNDAALAIAGDFDPAKAKAWVARYFGGLPRGPAITRPIVPPVTLATAKRLVEEDRVQIPRLYLRWPTVGEKSADSDALELLASILSGPRTARLTKTLVYDRQSAASVAVFQFPREDVGELSIIITPRPGHPLRELELATDSILQRLRSEGPTAAEMQRAKAGAQLSFIAELESNLGKAEQLLNGLVLHGDAGWFRTDYRRHEAVTAADVKRVAEQYLGAGRAVLSVVPTGKKDLASEAK